MLIIRADGNAKIGAGHLMRCLTIAKAVSAQGKCDEILFICADEDSAKMAQENGFSANVLYTDYRNMESEFDFKEADCGWNLWIKDGGNTILVDSYYVTDRYLEQLKKYGRVFLLDDLQEHAYPVDGIINYNVFAKEDVYRKLYAGRKIEWYLGSRYVPLREQFWNAAYGIRDEVRNVFITTGGGDADNIAVAVFECIADPDMVYHVLAGRFSPHFQSWQERADKEGNIRLYHDVRDMAGLMRECDLAVTAGGSTVYELAAVGVPFICFSYAKNQEALVEYIDRTDTAGSAGAWHLDAAACREKLRVIFDDLCRDRGLRQTYFERERRLVDGYGAKRLAEVLCL